MCIKVHTSSIPSYNQAFLTLSSLKENSCYYTSLHLFNLPIYISSKVGSLSIFLLTGILASRGCISVSYSLSFLYLFIASFGRNLPRVPEFLIFCPTEKTVFIMVPTVFIMVLFLICLSRFCNSFKEVSISACLPV